MITTLADGNPVAYTKNLGDTGQVTLVPADPTMQRRIEALSVSSGTGGSTFTMIFSRSANDFYIYNEFSVPANDTVFLKDYPLPLKKGESIKIQAGTANKLSVVAIMADILTVRDNRTQFLPRGAQA